MVDLPELRHLAWLWHTVANWSLAAVAIAEALAIGFEFKRFYSETGSKLFSRLAVLSLCVLVYADFKETPMRDAIEHELESIAQAQRESTLHATEELTKATARHEREIKLARDGIAKVLGIAGDANRRVSNLEAGGGRTLPPALAKALASASRGLTGCSVTLEHGDDPETAQFMNLLGKELARNKWRASGARAPGVPAAGLTVSHGLGARPDCLKALRAILPAGTYREQIVLADNSDAPINITVGGRPHAFAERHATR